MKLNNLRSLMNEVEKNMKKNQRKLTTAGSRTLERLPISASNRRVQWCSATVAEYRDAAPENLRAPSGT